MVLNRPARVPFQPAAVKPAEPTPITRTRTVKRYIAACTCAFANREKPQLHATREAAVVEAIRHLRAAHAEDLTIERQAKRTVQVQRTVLGDELLPGSE